MCLDDCQRGFPLGSCYSGQVATTASGRACVPWAGEAAQRWPGYRHNYCRSPCDRRQLAPRNPSGHVNGTWCYTADPSMPWESCGLPRCHEPVSGHCSVSSPCGEGEGDCDYNGQCKGGLVCGVKNCGGAYASTADCCYDPETSTGQRSYLNQAYV